MKCKVRSVKCEVWSVKEAVRSVKWSFMPGSMLNDAGRTRDSPSYSSGDSAGNLNIYWNE